MGTVEATRPPRVPGALPNGTILGRFELLGLLSVGGMAEIYLARTEGIAGFEKLVVLKRMLPHFAMQAEYVEMFLAEARLGAMLDHPNVVAVNDIGEETGNYYYAMEYVRGVDLRQIMKVQGPRGAMPLHCAIAIGLGTCAGLDHAHDLTDHAGAALGVVHRDVSLSNVLVSYDGAVKVTDFGVAKLTANDHRTRTGTLKGKIGYMSPEQCRGLALDRRSDIFSIGIILYELSTGRRLFRADESDFAILEKIVKRDVVPPSTYRRDYPAALEAIVLQALHRDRAQRYQTARDLQRDLERLARAEQLPTSATELADYVRALVPPAAPGERPHPPTRPPARKKPSGSTPALATRPPTEAPLEPWGPDQDYESLILGDAEALAGIPRPGRAGRARGVLMVLLIAALIGVIVAIALVPRDGDLPAVETASSPSPDPPAPAGRVEPAPAPLAISIDAATPIVEVQEEPSAPPRIAREDQRDRGTDHRRGHARDRGRARVAAVHTTPRLAPDAGAALPDAMASVTSELQPVDDPEPVVTEPVARPSSTSPKPTPTPAKPAPRPSVATADPPDAGSFDAVPSVSGIDVTGPLQDSEIRRGVGRVTSAFRACYRDAARAAGKTPAAKVRISFEIDETRAARDAKAGRAPLPGLASCLEGAASRIRTRIAPDVGNAQVTIHVSFAPTDP